MFTILAIFIGLGIRLPMLGASTGAAAPPAGSSLLLADGSSYLLLADGVSRLTLAA